MFANDPHTYGRKFSFEKTKALAGASGAAPHAAIPDGQLSFMELPNAAMSPEKSFSGRIYAISRPSS